jgi:hypothetical protein
LKYVPYQYNDMTVQIGEQEPDQPKSYELHDLHIELRNYLERIRYFN